MSNLSELGYRKCTECNGERVFLNHETNEMICHNCGYVVEELTGFESESLFFQRISENADGIRFRIYPISTSTTTQKNYGSTIRINSSFHRLWFKTKFWRELSIHLDRIHTIAKTFVFDDTQSFNRFKVALTNEIATVYLHKGYTRND